MPSQITSFDPHARPPDSFRKSRPSDWILFSQILSIRNEGRHEWSYLYSRLPYLLFYMHLLVEHICAEVAPTDPEYLRYCDRRLSALILLWWDILEPPYLEPHLRKFVLAT